jgi:ureidoglycolate hydrolase
MSQPTTTRHLLAQRVTPENFHPYGQVIFAIEDGKSFDEQDAQLNLTQGIPRFYIMRLAYKKRKFSQITRHLRCTQCLGAIAQQEWFIAVAPPGETAKPSVESIVAFRIPGNCFIKLNLGTWHAGPYFDQDVMEFYNLELSDTNITDHDTYNLFHGEGLELEII